MNDRRSFLRGAAVSAAAILASPAKVLTPPRTTPMGITLDQSIRLPKSHKELLYAWVIANGVQLNECRHVWIDTDGAAHFNLITTDGRGNLVLRDGELVEYWHCIPNPTPPPAIAWLPWEGVPA